MPCCIRRVCPICGKQGLLKLSEHLRQVHHLSSDDRQCHLKNAVFSPPITSLEMVSNQCMETKPYPTFQFKHPSMMMIVGPTQSGKTYFVEQLLKSNSIKYPSRKAKCIQWFYNQWQPLYDRLQSTLRNGITFTQGLPEVSDNLEDINDNVQNLWVLDDLMDEAVQSPIISQLFIRGRHRNLSVILLLQNMFAKGKFNTNISRNAQYMVLFRSPSDRKQMDMVAERIFTKDRPNFMRAYTKETEKPFGYIILDNHPRTTSDKQVVADVFGDCYAYPHITTSPYPVTQLPQSTTTTELGSIEEFKQTAKQSKRKVELEKPPAKKQKKRKVELEKPPTMKTKKMEKKETKPKVKRQRKSKIYKPRESSEEEEFDSEEEQFSYEDDSTSNFGTLSNLARTKCTSKTECTRNTECTSRT